MLVFQKNVDHVLDDGCERARIDPGWLVETVAEINCYLPDDWRLTRSRNNFRIQIVSTHTVALVGSCYRTTGDAILHIIDSLFLKHFFDCVDLANRGPRARGPVDKKALPEVLVPNLYFFRPCPEGFSSPLFARQYERIRRKDDGDLTGDQYHRIHPLTKAGLDLDRFMWVKWSVNGDVTVVETPDPAYHGKDYWMIPALDETRSRGDAAAYIALLDAVTARYGVHAHPVPDRVNAGYRTERKFEISGGESDAGIAFNGIADAMANHADWVVQDQDRRHAPQVDVYFDDDAFALHQAGASFRMRKKDATRVTLKKRFPDPGRPGTGLYRRIEEDAVITADQERELMAGRPVNVFPCRLIPYVAPWCGVLRPAVILENRRRTLHLRDAAYRKAVLCFDRLTYQAGGRSFGPFFEIEIQGKGAPDDALAALAAFVKERTSAAPVTISKYERGVRLRKAGDSSKA